VKTDTEFLYNTSKPWHGHWLYECVTLSPNVN